MAQRRNRVFGMPLRSRECLGGGNPLERQASGIRCSFFASDWFVGNEYLNHQGPLGSDAQAGVVVEAPPATPSFSISSSL